MVGMTGSFNAKQYQPNQGGGSIHPPANKIPFEITHTEIKPNSAGTGGFFEVALTSQLGTQIARYNIWYKGENEAKTVEIAHEQLSALCHVTGRYQIDWANEGAALHGGKGLMDVNFQRGHEPTTEKPNGGYTELKKVYDMAGNEPGKSGQAQPQTQPATQQSQPMTAQPGGGWQQGGGQPNVAQQAPQGQQQPNQNAAVQRGGWQPGGNGGQQSTSPPWGPR